MASDELGDELQAFNAEYRRGLPARVREIEALWSDLRRGKVSRERLHALLRALHSIAGSGATFGMPSVSEAAAAAEAWVEPCYERGALPEESRRGELDVLLAALRQAAGS
jgi:chemotaxis protein histidine kinase CheA